MRSINFKIILPVFIAVSIAAVLIMARGWDLDIFRHAAALLVNGQSPYLEIGFNNPPWALLPIFPTLPFVRELTVMVVAGLSLPVIARVMCPIGVFAQA